MLILTTLSLGCSALPDHHLPTLIFCSFVFLPDRFFPELSLLPLLLLLLLTAAAEEVPDVVVVVVLVSLALLVTVFSVPVELLVVALDAFSGFAVTASSAAAAATTAAAMAAVLVLVDVVLLLVVVSSSETLVFFVAVLPPLGRRLRDLDCFFWLPSFP